jgi:chromosome segregation ATPase
MDGSARAQGGGRFAHASAFAEETGGSIGGGGSLGAALNASLAGLTAEDAEMRRQRLEAEEGERQQELEDLRNAAQVAQGNLDALERQQGNASSKIRQLDSELAALLNEGEALEKEIMIKRKTLEMLPSAAENIGKLQAICGGSAKRLMQLAQEWETHRRPLVEKLRQLKANKMQRRNKCMQMVEEMKRCREEMAGMIQDLKDKQLRAQTLSEELSKLPKNINRTVYTHRIMDIITSIGKQNKDIDKIPGDIRDIQKTINNSTLTLQRADAVAEELIYHAANGPGSDHAMVDTYRRLKTLRARFEALVEVVGKIGVAEKQRRDLETKIDQEATRVSANNLERIKGDLDAVVKENAELVAAIKKAGSGR